MHASRDITHRPRDLGFTLVEVMTVLVIIGLMTSAVVLTFPRQDTPFEVQTEALGRNLNVMAQDAVLSGRSAAFGVSRDGFALYTYETSVWVETASQAWSPNTRVQFVKDDQVVKLPEELTPLIVFEATGLSDIFTLSLQGEDETVTFHSDGNGRVVKGGRTG